MGRWFLRGVLVAWLVLVFTSSVSDVLLAASAVWVGIAFAKGWMADDLALPWLRMKS